MHYKEKYIKYKNKYLQLKNQLRGGVNETKQKPYCIETLVAWPMFLYGFQTSLKQLKANFPRLNDNFKIPPITTPLQLSLMTRMRLITNGLCKMLVRKMLIPHNSVAINKIHVNFGKHILSRVYAYNSSAKCAATLQENSNVNSVAFHPTAHVLATGSDDNAAKLWQLSPDKSSALCVATLVGSFCFSLAFHPNAPLLATCSTHKNVRLWWLSHDYSSATYTTILKGHSGIILSVAFHPTAPFLATSSYDKTAKLWRLSSDNSSAECVATLEGHSNCVNSVAFHPTALLLATGSDDKTAKLWRL
jgi:hypothetical protein